MKVSQVAVFAGPGWFNGNYIARDNADKSQFICEPLRLGSQYFVARCQSVTMEIIFSGEDF